MEHFSILKKKIKSLEGVEGFTFHDIHLPHSHAALSLFEPLAVNNRNPPLLVAGRRLSHLHRSPPLTVFPILIMDTSPESAAALSLSLSTPSVRYCPDLIVDAAVPRSSHRRRNPLKHTAWLCYSPSRLYLQLHPQSGIVSSNC